MSSKGLSVSRRAVLAGVGSMPLAAWAGRAARLKRAPAWERQVELWGMQEVHLASQKSYVNPFADVEVGAEFSSITSSCRTGLLQLAPRE